MKYELDFPVEELGLIIWPITVGLKTWLTPKNIKTFIIISYEQVTVPLQTSIK